MAPITPVPSTRVSDLLVQQRLLTQIRSDERELFRIQSQLSTGRRILLPSEDTPAALRAARLQQLIERKDQLRVNLRTGQSFLAATDASLSGASGILADVRGAAVSVIDTVRSDLERQAVAQQVDQAIAQLMDIGNRNFRGRYLFAGTQTTVQPFGLSGPYVEYFGNEGELSSYSDIDQLFSTSLPGSEVFGAVSQEVRGTVVLQPALTSDTPLADLGLGKGIVPGSLIVSDGSATSLVDLSGAATIGDVARLIEANPPPGRELLVQVGAAGLELRLLDAGADPLVVAEVGGGTTARDLGIQTSSGGTVGGAVVGEDLRPRLTRTTSVSQLVGSRATARVVSSGLNNDLIVAANNNGANLNAVSIQFVDDDALQAAPGLAQGSEVAEFDASPRAARASLALLGPGNDLVLTAVNPGTDLNQVAIEFVVAGNVQDSPTAAYSDLGGIRKLTLGIDDSDETTVAGLKTAIEATGLFLVAGDPSAGEAFNPAVPVLTANAGLIRGNTSQSGGQANTLYVRVRAGESTAEDAARAINSQGTFSAQTDPRDALAPAQQGTGTVDLGAAATTSGGSGGDLDTSGLRVVNAGSTFDISLAAAQTVDDLLNILNGAGAGLQAEINSEGTGINVRSRLSGADFSIGELNGGTTATQLGIRSLTEATSLDELNRGVGVHTAVGTDFTIERNDGSTLEIDISSARTVGDVLELINNHPDNQIAGSAVVARLAATGNGIELVDDSPAGIDGSGNPNTLRVRRVGASLAAIHLGLIPAGESVGTISSMSTTASASAALAGPNTDMVFAAPSPGTSLGGTRIEFVNSAAVGDQAIVTYDAPSGTLRIDVDPAATRAATVVAAVNSEGTLTATLDTANGPNDGSGVVVDSGVVAVLGDGAPEVLTGRDVHPQETAGVFNTLIRLRDALLAGDQPEIERTVAMLEADTQRLNFSRSRTGARLQAVEAFSQRLEEEQIELKRSLSDEIDVDMAEAISNLTARQFAYQAALQSAARLLQLTVLDYL